MAGVRKQLFPGRGWRAGLSQTLIGRSEDASAAQRMPSVTIANETRIASKSLLHSVA